MGHKHWGQAGYLEAAVWCWAGRTGGRRGPKESGCGRAGGFPTPSPPSYSAPSPKNMKNMNDCSSSDSANSCSASDSIPGKEVLPLRPPRYRRALGGWACSTGSRVGWGVWTSLSPLAPTFTFMAQRCGTGRPPDAFPDGRHAKDIPPRCVCVEKQHSSGLGKIIPLCLV